MNNQFWIDRWAENRIGFHRDGIQPLLEKHWLGIARGGTGRVLVPMCGKSHDLTWLAARGHQVVGVELSHVAARSFAQEHGLEFQVVEDPPFTRMQSETIELLVGDFFDLTPGRAGRFGLVYDRAALIALPPERRPAYVMKVKEMLDRDGHVLLITIEWDLEPDVGPPWGVGEAEVRDLFAGHRVDRVDMRDCLHEELRFRERGATWMREAAYHIRPAAGVGRDGIER
jgi:thiopurine S-methyltransferase